jgi:hypothetical protein
MLEAVYIELDKAFTSAARNLQRNSSNMPLGELIEKMVEVNLIVEFKETIFLSLHNFLQADPSQQAQYINDILEEILNGENKINFQAKILSSIDRALNPIESARCREFFKTAFENARTKIFKHFLEKLDHTSFPDMSLQ